MTILIDDRSAQPIYDQIFTQVRQQIVSGDISEDAPLPSVRTLAKDLRISVITTRRAYDELEAAGFIYTVAGKGSFVAAKSRERIIDDSLRRLDERLHELRALAGQCGMDENGLIERLRSIWRE